MAQTGKLNYVERILQLSTEKDELEGVADQYGQPTWSRDLALATQKLIDGQSPFGTYHLTNSGKASWHTWAEEILKLKGINIPLRKNTMANFDKSGHIASRPQFGLLINTKTEPLRSWQEALKDYLQTL
jgi:dTDP-4-dehydrorhamnose reductase